MNDEKKDQKPRVYFIPPNIVYTGSIWYGRIKLINCVEAVTVGYILLLICKFFGVDNMELGNQIMVKIFAVGPIFFMFIIGVNGSSLGTYLILIYRYVVGRRRLFFRAVSKENYIIKDEKSQLSNIINIANKTKKRFDKSDTSSKSDTSNKDEVTSNSKVKKTVNYTQDALPIKEITKGIIITKDGRYVKILEVTPISFEDRKESDKNIVINRFEGLLRVMSSSFQIKIVSEKSNPSEFVEKIQEKMNEERNPKVFDALKMYRRAVKKTSYNSAITKKYYLSYEFEQSEDKVVNDVEAIGEYMNSIKNKISSALSGCGNEVRMFHEYEEENQFLEEVLYKLLNKRTSKKESYLDRVDALKIFADKIFLDDKYKIPSIDKIAPKGMNFEHRRYSIVDGMYHSHIVLNKEGIPNYVLAGWIAGLLPNIPDMELDIFVRKIDKETAKNRVTTMRTINYSRASGADNFNTDLEDVVDVYSAATQVKTMLKNEDFYYTTVILTISASTREKLNQIKNNIKTNLKSNEIGCFYADFEEESAFISCLPLVKLDHFIKLRTDRNILTKALSSCYPFIQKEINSPNGIWLGIETSSSSMFMPDIFDTSTSKNANIYITGGSGAGKTYSVALIAERFRLMGVQVFVITSKKSHEYIKLCDALDGNFIDGSGQGKVACNPFDISPRKSPLAELIDENVNEVGSELLDTISFLKVWFDLVINNLTDEEENMLDILLLETYRKKGFTEDNNSLYTDETKTTIKPSPIFSDFITTIYESNISQQSKIRFITLFSKFITGSLKKFNQVTNIDLNNKFNVISLEGLAGNKFKAAANALMIRMVNKKVKSDVTRKKVVIFEEGWDQVSDKQVANMIEDFFRTIRGYYGSAIFVTQFQGDGLDGDSSSSARAIIGASAIKIVFGMETEEAEIAKTLLKLTNEETKKLEEFSKGQGLYCTGKLHVPIKILASEYEHNLITTDGNELKKQALRRKENANE